MIDLKSERENYEGGDNDYENQNKQLLKQTNSSVPGTIDYEGDSQNAAVSHRAKESISDIRHNQEDQPYYQPKGIVKTSAELEKEKQQQQQIQQESEQFEKIMKKRKKKENDVNLPAENQVNDQDIVNMQKPLTVQYLNQMFQERHDVFEYPNERADWKYPQHVKIEKTKGHKQQEIAFYNEMNVTKQNIKYSAMNNFYEEEEQFYVQK